MKWQSRLRGHVKRSAAIYGHVTRISEDTSLSIFISSHCSGDDSPDEFRLARQSKWSSLSEKISGDFEGHSERTVFKIPGKRQSETLSETHQDLLLHSNPNLYWKDWSDSLPTSAEDLRDWLPTLSLWVGCGDPQACSCPLQTIPEDKRFTRGLWTGGSEVSAVYGRGCKEAVSLMAQSWCSAAVWIG